MQTFQPIYEGEFKPLNFFCIVRVTILKNCLIHKLVALPWQLLNSVPFEMTLYLPIILYVAYMESFPKGRNQALLWDTPALYIFDNQFKKLDHPSCILGFRWKHDEHKQ